MAVNVKLGVDLSGFNSGIREGQGILKGLNAEMKATEAEFNATGNAEQMLTNKTKVLSQQIRVQKGIATEAEKALKAMTDAGVDPANAAYQKLYATMMNATAGMNNAQAELNALGASAQDAAAGADQLTTSVNNIGKKISLDQVIGGINKITSGLEAAAKKAESIAKSLWNGIMDSAMLSDDIATQARVFDMTPEMYQRYKGVFDTIGEVTMQEWRNVRRKIENAMEDPSNDQIDVLKALGFAGKEAVDGGNGSLENEIKLTADTWEDAFWGIATEIKRRVDSGEISIAQADVWGEALFGKKYANMKTLIDMGQEAFAHAINQIDVTSDDAIEKNAALNDAVIDLQNSYKALEAQLVSGVAPALTDATKALDGLLSQLLEYLKTEKGQEMLKSLGDSVAQLFEGMKNINAEDVVSGFKDAFDKVMDVLNWIVNNRDTVVAALEGIFGFWATLKVSDGVLTILKVINGLKDLAGLGGAGALGSGLGQALTQGATSVAGLAGNGILMNNIPVIGDWFMNQTSVGRALGGKHADTWESVGKEFENWQREVFGDNGLIANFWNDLSHLGDENYDFEKHQLKIEPEVEIPPEEKESIQQQIDAMTPEMKLKVILDFQFGGGPAVESDGTGWAPKANGISFVPYDGYLAQLHKGERVVPAREVQSRSYNSNLYVESMIMNNGTDAAGLASAMAAAQQRTMIGFGS